MNPISPVENCSVQTVFRVENKDGQGPYRFGSVVGTSDIIGSHNWENFHPAPYQDIGILRNPISNEICAFVSLDSLLEWFTGLELKQLEYVGFYIVPVQAVVTAKGNKQILCKLSLTPST